MKRDWLHRWAVSGTSAVDIIVYIFVQMFLVCTMSDGVVSVSPVEPKPVYAQPGQPDVDLPVSPSDAPVPIPAHDDSILR